MNLTTLKEILSNLLGVNLQILVECR